MLGPRSKHRIDSARRRREEHDHTDIIAMCLRDAPLTLPELQDQVIAVFRRFGFFGVHSHEPDHAGSMAHRHPDEGAIPMARDLDKMMEMGWVVRQGERYALTPLGCEEADERLAGLRSFAGKARKLLHPQTVSQVGLLVHLGLAALKLPAGLLSGSVGLINDATDTLLDGLSSLLVYAGLRFDKERAVNVVLVLFMLGTGGLTCYQAVRRLFVPVDPVVDWFTFAAAIISALVCGMLWLYQRTVGLRSGSVALITQSVDSRNHVIVAVSVTAGLVAALLRFPLLDTLVGLAVAGLILQSAVELAIETVRSLGDEEVDLSRYKAGLAERYEQFRQAQLGDWMLYLVEKQGVLTRAELVARARQALDFSGNPALRELGLGQQLEAGEMTERTLAELLERGWLAGDGQLSVTGAGRERLRRQMGQAQGKVRQLSSTHSPRSHAASQ